MRKPDCCIYENKGADQLCGNRAADHRPCFCYIVQSLYILYPKFQAILCGCAAWFVSDLVGNPENRFSHDAAHVIKMSRVSLSTQKLFVNQMIFFSSLEQYLISDQFIVRKKVS